MLIYLSIYLFTYYQNCNYIHTVLKSHEILLWKYQVQ